MILTKHKVHEGLEGLKPGPRSAEPEGIWAEFRLIFRLKHKI